MAKVGAQRAAELTGRSKSTIQRAMNSGKLSFEVDGNGRRLIDASELDRVFGLLPQNGDTAQKETTSSQAELQRAADMLEIERLKMRVKALEEQLDITREQLEDMRGQRDLWQKQSQQILITSQYSQKQAEELKAELVERDRKAKLRRQHEVEAARATTTKRPVAGTNENKPAITVPAAASEADKANSFDIQVLWKKIRGDKNAA